MDIPTPTTVAFPGFCGDNVLFYLEKQALHYIIAMKLNGSIASQIVAQKGLEYCSFDYKAQGWKAARRLVVVRKDTGELPHASGRTLFSEYDEYGRYRYSVFVTNTKLSASMVWDLYRHRAEATAPDKFHAWFRKTTAA